VPLHTVTVKLLPAPWQMTIKIVWHLKLQGNYNVIFREKIKYKIK